MVFNAQGEIRSHSGQVRRGEMPRSEGTLSHPWYDQRANRDGGQREAPGKAGPLPALVVDENPFGTVTQHRRLPSAETDKKMFNCCFRVLLLSMLPPFIATDQKGPQEAFLSRKADRSRLEHAHRPGATERGWAWAGLWSARRRRVVSLPAGSGTQKKQRESMLDSLGSATGGNPARQPSVSPHCSLAPRLDVPFGTRAREQQSGKAAARVLLHLQVW